MKTVSNPAHGALRLVIAGVAVLVVAALALFLAVRYWPFTEQMLAKEFNDKFAGSVEIKKFRRTFFPSPGCIAEGLTLRRATDLAGKPFLYIQKFTIQARYLDLVMAQRRVAKVQLEGLRVSMPVESIKSTFDAGARGGNPIGIGTLLSYDSEIELTRQGASEPLTFRITHLKMSPINAGRPTSFQVGLLNAQPPGEIRAEGQFGPVPLDKPEQTPLSGSYKFLHSNLGVFHGIAGILSSHGNFQGTLKAVVVDDATSIPDFEVTRSGHPVDLETKFHVIVNGTNGDVFLDPAISHFGQTTVISSGSVAGQHGKTVTLDMAVTNGRVQDLLRLVVKSDRAPMSGAVNFRGKVTVPPGKQPFLEKLYLEGDFGIGGGQFTNTSTQSNVNALSARAEGDKDMAEPESVVSDIKGHVLLDHGVAAISNLSFSVPGAFVRMHGTYNLISQGIDLHGTLKMDVKLSQATNGIKSFLLKAIDPLFKKRNGAGSVIPVKVSGTYSNPTYGLDLIK